VSQPWPHPAAVPARPRSGLGVGALVFGLLGLLFSMVPLAGFACGLAAVWTGFAARRQRKRGYVVNNGAAIAGIVLGMLVVVAGVVIVGAFAFYFIHYQLCVEHAHSRSQLSLCG
jgi:lysylphosphatidylglycerol synthetase-like protein (DUF2156 family)